jgi:methionine aminopeptidase
MSHTIIPDLTKYNASAKICEFVYNKLKDAILIDSVLSVKTLYKIGMDEITNQCNMIFKKLKRKGIACPISININNCIDNYTPNSTDEDIIIKPNDIIKIKLGVDIDSNIVIFGNTFIYNKQEEDSYIMFLTQLKKDILKHIYHGNTNDEVRIMIESKCTEYNCFPLINCKSIQNDENVNDDELPKYMILNYEKKYDKDEYLIQENECFEFLQNEIYTINLTIIPESENDDNKNMLKHDSNLYKITDIYNGLKLKSSRVLYSTIYDKHYNNICNITDYTKDIKLKLGLSECVNKQVLEELPVYYLKNKMPVYSSIFTICVKDKHSTAFN